MIEPDIFVVAKCGRRKIFYADIFNIYDHKYATGVNVPNRIRGIFLWEEGSKDYKKFQKRYEGLFDHQNIRDFKSFHNHETTDYVEINDYIITKFLKFMTQSKYKEAKIADLRVSGGSKDFWIEYK